MARRKSGNQPLTEDEKARGRATHGARLAGELETQRAGHAAAAEKAKATTRRGEQERAIGASRAETMIKAGFKPPAAKVKAKKGDRTAFRAKKAARQEQLRKHRAFQAQQEGLRGKAIDEGKAKARPGTFRGGAPIHVQTQKGVPGVSFTREQITRGGPALAERGAELRRQATGARQEHDIRTGRQALERLSGLQGEREAVGPITGAGAPARGRALDRSAEGLPALRAAVARGEQARLQREGPARVAAAPTPTPAAQGATSPLGAQGPAGPSGVAPVAPQIVPGPTMQLDFQAEQAAEAARQQQAMQFMLNQPGFLGNLFRQGTPQSASAPQGPGAPVGATGPLGPAGLRFQPPIGSLEQGAGALNIDTYAQDPNYETYRHLLSPADQARVSARQASIGIRSGLSAGTQAAPAAGIPPTSAIGRPAPHERGLVSPVAGAPPLVPQPALPGTVGAPPAPPIAPPSSFAGPGQQVPGLTPQLMNHIMSLNPEQIQQQIQQMTPAQVAQFAAAMEQRGVAPFARDDQIRLLQGVLDRTPGGPAPVQPPFIPQITQPQSSFLPGPGEQSLARPDLSIRGAQPEGGALQTLPVTEDQITRRQEAAAKTKLAGRRIDIEERGVGAATGREATGQIVDGIRTEASGLDSDVGTDQDGMVREINRLVGTTGLSVADRASVAQSIKTSAAYKRVLDIIKDAQDRLRAWEEVPEFQRVALGQMIQRDQDIITDYTLKIIQPLEAAITAGAPKGP